MPRVLTTTAALLLLSMIPSAANTTSQPASDAAKVGPAGLVRLALNPQPEPPNIPRTSDNPSGKKSKPKAVKQPKKGDPGH